MVQHLPVFEDPNLIIGAESFSDAGIYRLTPDLAIVQSTDFFSPLVDDPYTFGQIAAANSMSDIFAMGATVRTALNIVCFPDKEADLSILNAILNGGAERVKAAGGVILGGHSIRDQEIKYGLAVTGTIHPDQILTNQNAQPGDLLILTKSLGTGYITTANRANTCPDEYLQVAIQSMIQLNDHAAQTAIANKVNAATDITGFGLAGHAHELAEASNVTLQINTSQIPLLPGTLELATQGNLTRANATNQSHIQNTLKNDTGNPLDSLPIATIFDPQTSGGLLLSIPPQNAQNLLNTLQDQDPQSPAKIIGTVLEAQSETTLLLKP